MKFTFARLFASTILAVTLAGHAHACSCIKRLTTKDHYSAATYVFVGRVVAIREIKSRADIPDWGGVAAEFQLIEVLKGPHPFLSGVETGYGHGDCGVPMFVGVSYVFFARAKGEIDICSGTRAYIKGYEGDEEYLREIKSLPPVSKAP
jgi:hypothetical protein